MKIKIISFLVILTMLCAMFSQTVPVEALSQAIYIDDLTAGWQDWSWTTINLAAASPVHSGSRSVSVSFGAWQGVTFHKPGVDTLGYTHLRFFIHGGNGGGQKMNLYLNLVINGQNQNGPKLPVPVAQANAWYEVRLALSELNPANALITGITWQESTGKSQGTFYLDDISLISDENPAGPQLSAGQVGPRSLQADGVTILTVRATVTDPQGVGDVRSVSLDAAELGQGIISLKDDGRSNDGQANDGVYGAALTVPPGVAGGDKRLLLTAVDLEGHSAYLPLGTVNVLAAPGGGIPTGLPQRIGWGTNDLDWQVSSGVPWDYVYHYITYGWETWGNTYVSRFVNQAWSKNFIPMVTVYLILDTPPTCGETPACYTQKLQNPNAVQAYLASLLRAAQQANGTKPVIFNIEPDFYGYMQQYSRDPTRPAGIKTDDPTSYPVALNINGYPNTLAGFGRYLVDLIHQAAPNALVAPMASMWATNANPQAVTADEALQMGRSTAAFIDAMGGTQADLLIAEWSDRDAGSGLRPWWDDTDWDFPRPTRAILWENALSVAAHKRLMLWQIPVGNMGLDNTCNHYRDNRAAYLFRHPRDLVDAGVFAVLFGGGADCMTQASTDGGFVAAQGAIAYGLPSAPTGLSASSPSSGMVVTLRWNEAVEPDAWGYRLYYRLAPNGSISMREMGRLNGTTLLLPRAGTWEIWLTTIDAMGNEGPKTVSVQVVSTGNAWQFFIPKLNR